MSAMPPEMRLPPHNRDAERALISSMLRDHQLVADVVQLVTPDDFYVFAHRKIFEAQANLDSAGKPADLVTIAEWLTSRGALDDAGGHGYLCELWDAAPSAAGYRHYAAIISDAAIKRRIIHATTEIAAQANTPGESASEALDAAERVILDIAERSTVGDTLTLEQAVQSSYARLDEKLRGTRTAGIPTGFLELDAIISGLHESELTLLAARPSVGKTALALAISKNVAMESGLPVLFVSLEQPAVDLADRLISSHGMIDGHKIRMGVLDIAEREQIITAGEQLGRTSFFISDSPTQNMMRIAANARRLKRRHDIRLVVVDYLQLIQPENSHDNRNEQVAGVSRRLKGLARELKIPVLALSQFNRAADTDEPRMSNLRDSGSLEQDADAVLMMWRPNGDRDNLVEVIVGKQRNGPIGRVHFAFRKEFMRYEPLTMEHRAMGDIRP